MQYLLDKLNAFATWILSLVVYMVEKAWDLITTGLGLILQAIPVPSWLSNAGNVIGNIPPGVAYLANAFMIPQGLTIIISAYTLRFIVRRIPLIG